MSTASKFAVDLLKRIDNFAVASNRTDMCELAIDQALAPLRECLEGLLRRFEQEFEELTDGQFGSIDNFSECRAAQKLLERLKIQ